MPPSGEAPIVNVTIGNPDNATPTPLEAPPKYSEKPPEFDEVSPKYDIFELYRVRIFFTNMYHRGLLKIELDWAKL